MKIKYKKLFFVCLLVFFITLPATIGLNKIKINYSSALEVNYPSFLGLTVTQNSSLPEYAKYFFNLGMALAGALALLVIVFGGVHYLIAFAGGGFRDNGKEWIKSGVIGLLVLLSSYLIVYTINPDLVYFRLERLFPILSRIFPPNNPSPNQTPSVYYKEIPLGILSEKLVSRTMDCYDFDAEGNPIEGDEARTGSETTELPTYLDLDRIECFLKLADAAQKKSKVIKDLSDKIIELMKQCSCQGKCDLTCDTCAYNGACPAPDPKAEGLCSGNCIEAGCQGKNDCCPEGVKDKIQGTNKKTIDIKDCQGNIKKYKGLEEFRTDLFNVSSLVESQIQIGEKTITVIDRAKWQKLKLIEQLKYLREKMAQIKSEVQFDLDQLKAAKTDMTNCYDVKSSADFLKIKENTEKDKKIVEVQRAFADPATSKPIDPSKYCKGFNYYNSSCFKTCQNKCPDSSIEAASRYAACGTCKPDNLKCLEKQQACVEKKYDERPCLFSSSKDDSDFAGCIESCQKNCLDNCREKYINYSSKDNDCPPGQCKGEGGVCSTSNCDEDYSPEKCDHYDQFKICQNQCNNNSKCILDNKDKCLIDGSGFQKCKDQNNNDPSNLKTCIDNNYLCKYGSNEYAGYPDCLKYANPDNYSSSYIFENPYLLKCPDPYKIVDEEESQAYCLEIFEQTAKCPPNSKCPECPCGFIDEEIVFSNENTDCPPGECLDSDGKCSPENCDNNCPPGYCLGPEGCSLGNCYPEEINNSKGSQGEKEKITIPVKKYVLTSAECSEFAYNKDPLTFYCRIGWEPEAPLSGKWSDCSKAEEIPVGQTVDDSIKWGDDIIEKLSPFDDTIGEMLDFIKKIGDKDKDEYCKCDSKYDSDNEDKTKAGKPICQSDCQYNEVLIPYPPDLPVSSSDSANDDGYLKCFCSIVPCLGNPCQQMIDYLSKIAGLHEKIRQSFIDFYIYFILEERTEVLKELTYSRKEMNSCSQQVVKKGEETTKTINCTRAYGNNFINKRCYGILDGQIKNEGLTDNWFCCKEALK